MQRVVPISGGGDVAIETTRALTAIDVDARDRNAIPDAEMFALDLNLAAAAEAARQIALRGIGGLVVIDFLTLRQGRHKKEVAGAFRTALAGWLGRASKVLEMSELGVCEAAIARRIRPVGDSLAAAPEEREALDALREIESAGWSARGGRICARVSAKSRGWIEGNPDATSALNDRIGARGTIEYEERPPGKPDVWSA